MRVLAITTEVEAAIAKVVAHAETHPVVMTDPATVKPIGDDPNYRVAIPMGYCAVFSIEEQPNARCRHLSVSVDAPGRCPNVPAVQMLMPYFGFKAHIEKCLVWVEHPDPADPEYAAVNILEKMP